MNKTMITYGMTLGCDPEVFLVDSKTGAVVGSERAIVDTVPVVRDGVQVELHPSATSCRQGLASGLSSCFRTLQEQLLKHPKLKVSFDQVVELSDEEVKKLSKKSLELGCAPSLNAYGRQEVKVDGSIYRKRSAAGHIHFGIGKNVIPKPDEAVRTLDLVLGVPCVLLDRDPHAAERRKLYGKAGEYRLPVHGLEYRTLSNFWLRSYQLYSLVMGLARQGLSIYVFSNGPGKNWLRDVYGSGGAASSFHTDGVPQLTEGLNWDRVEEVINTNDFAGAQEIYKKHVRPFFAGIKCNSGLSSENIGVFDMVVDKGINHFWKADPFNHWVNINTGTGWERFAEGHYSSASRYIKEAR